MLQTLIQKLLSINWLLFLTINAPAGHTPILDTLMSLLAEDALYLFPLLILFLWWIPGGRSPAARSERSISREAVLWSIAAVLLALVVNVLLGTLIYEPRPFVGHPQDHQLIPHPADASFPSDHAAVSFAIAGALLLRFWLASRMHASPETDPSLHKEGYQALSGAALRGLRRRTGFLAGLALLLAVAIGYARVYTGVHYPFDILGGAIIGLLAAWIALLARRLLRPAAQFAERVAQQIHLA
jgi:undecaprenyl-diphosphatase